MRAIRWILLVAAVTVLSPSCGGDDSPSAFIIQVNATDVILNAVDRVEIILRPGELDRQFRREPDMTFEGGEVFTRVSAAGELVITAEREYVHARSRMDTPGTTFIFELPVQPAPGGDPDVADPMIEVNLVRGTERIGTGVRLLQWPLPPGGRAIVTVRCNRPEFDRQCTNNDPIAGSDAGTELDAGTPGSDGG